MPGRPQADRVKICTPVLPSRRCSQHSRQYIKRGGPNTSIAATWGQFEHRCAELVRVIALALALPLAPALVRIPPLVLVRLLIL